MKERLAELLYHPDPAARLQGVELALLSGEAPLTVAHDGAVEAPLGVNGPVLRVLLEAPAALRAQVRTLYLASSPEVAPLLPGLAALPNLRALHLLGDTPLDLASLAGLPLESLAVEGDLRARDRGLRSLDRLSTLELLRSLTLPYLVGEDLAFLPPGLASLRLPSLETGGWPSDLRRFPLEELDLPYIPLPEFAPADFPALRRLSVAGSGENIARFSPWPLDRLRLREPTDAALRALADHPTLRDLALYLKREREEPHRTIIGFDLSLLGDLARLEVFTPDYHVRSDMPAFPWPAAARCPAIWLQADHGRWGESLSEVQRRSRGAWLQAGCRWSLRAPAARPAERISGIKALRHHWQTSRAELSCGLLEGKVMYDSLADGGIPFLDEREARMVQALLLSSGTPVAIEPMAEEPA